MCACTKKAINGVRRRRLIRGLSWLSQTGRPGAKALRSTVALMLVRFIGLYRAAEAASSFAGSVGIPLTWPALADEVRSHGQCRSERGYELYLRWKICVCADSGVERSIPRQI